MKYYFLLFLSILFISCGNDSDPVIYQTDENIVEYLTENDITATKTESGLYYTVTTPGNGEALTENAKVTFSYKLSLLDGSVVEESNSEGITVLPNQLILGLAEGIFIFEEGSEGTMYIPPSLGYGYINAIGIPAGSVLIFDIKVIKIETADEEILAYLEENDIEAIKTETGLYYHISKEGEGEYPTSTSDVTAAYKGYFTNGEIFDQNQDGVSFNLTQVIDGWKEGLTYFNTGSEGILFVPPSLGYGYTERTGIPVGSVLIYEIKVQSVD
jgi:FKBP-type peptidyl-prolyl cis-trans isomerase